MRCAIARCEGREERPTADDLLRRVVAECTARNPDEVRVRHTLRRPATAEIPHGPPIHVSIAHSAGWVAVAADLDDPIGIDVEPRDRRVIDPARLAQRFFHLDDTAWLRSQPDQNVAFLQLWTMKESIGKLRGIGLQGGALAARNFGTPNRVCGSSALRPTAEPSLFHGTLLTADWVLSVAAPRRTRMWLTRAVH
ncbi:4'-phosphopantetheinyl transferase family protein [Flexivirga oryzae]|uniref:Phosphopantetheinyl transferase n=1 Tax=Flexivirga oryzae TaxID=1794944 RepID=A0A839NF64_9MICO|nr:4'-phosphopantetheinyl transferase superfamily protein [Flexivirga oryzae]MBB2893331.1 phosphopantetheinyl transferase [Flexivirga oryzae]